MTHVTRFTVMLCGLAGPLAAQSAGAIGGHVKDVNGAAIEGARVSVDSNVAVTLSDAAGAYRIREVRLGWHRVRASAIGFQAAVRESVLVQSWSAVTVDFVLNPQAIEVAPVKIEATPDVVLDPRATATTQRIAGDELRQLPVSTVEQSVSLLAGAVGESYRGGRIGEQSFIIDGLGVKNQLDASSGGLGVRMPVDMLEEVALVTDGFSARYGQAVSGMINMVTRDGGDRWGGRAAYETDRPLPSGWDYGLDRFVVEADGPLPHGARALGVIDATGNVDAEPVAAPPPTDPRDPRYSSPWLLPHNSSEVADVGGKLTVPFGSRETLRLTGLGSVEQRLLYDPEYKYDPAFAPVRRISGTLAGVQWQHRPGTEARHPFFADLHLGYFNREFLRGTSTDSIQYAFGGFTGKRLHIVGEDIARAQDTAAARAPVPGLPTPDFSDRTPWGVPAFFLGGGSNGEVAWNRFQEMRAQLDMQLGTSPNSDFYFGGAFVQQHVQTFSRTLGYLPVGDTVPPAVASDFKPVMAALYAEAQLRASDIAATLGLRYDQFDPRALLEGGRLGARSGVSPRFAISAPLKGATFIASWGRFNQAPDFQYLVDAAFDDTARTGHFRQGNPDVGFETSTQYQFSVRSRPTALFALRFNVYVRRIEGLVASVPLGVNPDSSIFGNADFGTVKGAEVLVEHEFSGTWGLRASYTLQSATATASNAFQIRPVVVDSITKDTIPRGQVEFPLDYDRRHSLTVVAQGRAPDTWRGVARAIGAGATGAVIFRYASGLPYSRTNATGDSLIGLPNSARLPAQWTLDMLLRKRFNLGHRSAGVYLDARNVLNRQNVIAVRRDTGEPTASNATLQSMAQSAYAAHPEPIPYESSRYRAWADLNHDGYVAGPTELMPLYLAAARDYTAPLLYYGPPRLLRLGMELVF
ncbi:MAG TPA: TonB-dependent receptor [Gemmatimonadales bacterium]|nr:TonB-dependent receptor [Gemmatimonadales bacterium]